MKDKITAAATAKYPGVKRMQNITLKAIKKRSPPFYYHEAHTHSKE